MAFTARAAKRIAGTEGCVGLVDKAVGQMFVTAPRPAQAGGLDDLLGTVAVVVNDQALGVQLLRIPLRYLQVQRAAQQGLAIAQPLCLARFAVGRRVQSAHQCQAVRAADVIHHGIAGLDQYPVARAGGADIQ